MRVLLIHQIFLNTSGPGGTRHFEFSRRLIRAGHQVTVIAGDVHYATGSRIGNRRRALFTRSVEDGIEIIRVFTLPYVHGGFARRVLAFLGFMVGSFVAALRAEVPDVVFGTTPPIFQAFAAYLVSRIRRKPFLLEVRDLWPDFAIDMGVLKNPLLIRLSFRLERFLYRHADHIVVNSPAYIGAIAAKDIVPEKIALVANGADLDLFVPSDCGDDFRRKIGAGPRFVLTYAGAIGAANSIGLLLDAAERLRERENILFAIVGDGPERPRLERDAQERKLSNVIFTGSVPKKEMPDVLAGSDGCLAVLRNIPMFTMTYPNKVFDYMAAGRPILLMIGGVIADVVRSAECGLLVPPGDPQALASAAVDLAADRLEARAMGTRGRIYVERHFNRDDQAEQFERLLASAAVS